MANTHTWTGKSGEDYRYFIYPIDTNLKSDPGNYIFSHEYSPGLWAAVYIGETGDLSERFDSHHQKGCIQRSGATHIHVHTSSPDAYVRRREEKDLIAQWNPPCNG